MKNNNRHIVIGTDANYLPRALVFYKSLSSVHSNFVLHVFCFDEVTYNVLKKLNYENIIIYRLSEIENKELLKAKSTKKRMYEYYWTLNPAMGKRIIGEQNIDFIALADCDMMFFDSPESIFEEFYGADVIIQPNNFSFQHEKDLIPVGYYCTSFQCFRKNKNGKAILGWWYDQCVKWCSSKFEEGKFGDQKYLDDWRIRFKNVREVENPGTNVAPWNIQKFDVSKRNKKIFLNNKWPLVYYHFHSFRMSLTNYKFIITGDRKNSYKIDKNAINLIYSPYIKLMKETIKMLKKVREYKEFIKTNPGGLQKDFNGKPIKFVN